MTTMASSLPKLQMIANSDDSIKRNWSKNYAVYLNALDFNDAGKYELRLRVSRLRGRGETEIKRMIIRNWRAKMGVKQV